MHRNCYYDFCCDQTSDLDKIKQQLVQQEKELMEIKEKKLMLELEQTKQKLESKQKEMNNILVRFNTFRTKLS